MFWELPDMMDGLNLHVKYQYHKRIPTYAKVKVISTGLQLQRSILRHSLDKESDPFLTGEGKGK